MSRNDYNLHSGEIISLFRIRCDRHSICDVLETTRDIILKSLSHISTIPQFYRYEGREHSVPWVLSKNLETGLTPRLPYLIVTDKESFYAETTKRLFIYEIIIGMDADISHLHYLFILLQYLEHYHEKYIVLFSGPREGKNRYTPIDTKNYFKLSHLFYFFSETTDHLYSTSISSRIKAFHLIKRKDGEETSETPWISLASSTKGRLNNQLNMEFGRIIPSLPITQASFQALSHTYKEVFTQKEASRNPWLNAICELCLQYKQRIDGLLNTSSERRYDFLESDNLLEALLFFSTYYYMLRNKAVSPSHTSSSVISLHEACSDYSQGIMQLIENIIIHVLNRDETTVGGCGVLTIRFRTKQDASQLYLNHPEPTEGTSPAFEDVNHFLEVYLSDFCYDYFEGIVNRFIRNVERRMDEAPINTEEFWTNAKLLLSHYGKEKAHGIIAQKSPEVKALLSNYVDSMEAFRCITLSDLFLLNETTPLYEYLSKLKNIAFHYGLQILVSVITTGEGYLHVRSGIRAEEDAYYNDNAEYNTNMDFNFYHGTTYTIYLPIKVHHAVSYLDSVAVLDSSQPTQSFPCITFALKDHIGTVMQCESKEARVKLLNELIEDTFDAENEAPHEAIGIIRCDRIQTDNKQILYEILAKSLFMYLAKDCAKINNLAVINVDNRYDVIKIFRQFALFFNRSGQNNLIGHDKSIFIVDRQAHTDILFYGKNLASIRQSLAASQLYGGTDEKAIEIVRHISEVRMNEHS